MDIKNNPHSQIHLGAKSHYHLSLSYVCAPWGAFFMGIETQILLTRTLHDSLILGPVRIASTFRGVRNSTRTQTGGYRTYLRCLFCIPQLLMDSNLLV